METEGGEEDTQEKPRKQGRPKKRLLFESSKISGIPADSNLELEGQHEAAKAHDQADRPFVGILVLRGKLGIVLRDSQAPWAQGRGPQNRFLSRNDLDQARGGEVARKICWTASWSELALE